MNTMNLEGKTALITGATGQLGQAITLVLAEAGVHCICHFHSQESRAMELIGLVERLNCKAWTVRADLSNPAKTEEMFNAAIKQSGTIEILINSAALFERCKLAELTPEILQRMLNVNLSVPILLSRLFVDHFTNHNSGKSPLGGIVNLSDAGAIRPWAEYSAYCSSKAGLIGLTKSLAKELAPLITVNAVAPGIVEESAPKDPAERKKQIQRIPVGRFASAREIAQAVIFCLRQDYLTGQVLTIDGGRTL